MKIFDEMVEIMHKLRSECPWDKKQDFQSLKKYLLEESYECLEAIETVEDRPEALEEELGDLLLQVLFHSELLSEKFPAISIESVISKLKDKMIRRHPHVFQKLESMDAETVKLRWDQIKSKEKKAENLGLMDLVSPKFPSTIYARKIGERSSQVKFDWDSPDAVWNQVESEMEELKSATTFENKKEELGDVIFSLVQWGRHMNIDSEEALNETNQKFLYRFRKMEGLCKQRNLHFSEMTLEEKEALWQEVKSH